MKGKNGRHLTKPWFLSVITGISFLVSSPTVQFREKSQHRKTTRNMGHVDSWIHGFMGINEPPTQKGWKKHGGVWPNFSSKLFCPFLGKSNGNPWGNALPIVGKRPWFRHFQFAKFRHCWHDFSIICGEVVPLDWIQCLVCPKTSWIPTTPKKSQTLRETWH